MSKKTDEKVQNVIDEISDDKSETMTDVEQDDKHKQSDQEEQKQEDKEAEEPVKPISELDALKNENQSLKDNVLRVQAEFQNFKRRTEKEKSDIYKYANERIILELLGLMDNFDRAIGSMSSDETSDDASHKSVLEGVNMMKNSLYELLQNEGVAKIEALGTEFDPNMHHAVMTESKEGCDSDIVIEEFQVGYKLGEKVIRPAMVKVSC